MESPLIGKRSPFEFEFSRQKFLYRVVHKLLVLLLARVKGQRVNIVLRKSETVWAKSRNRQCHIKLRLGSQEFNIQYMYR